MPAIRLRTGVSYEQAEAKLCEVSLAALNLRTGTAGPDIERLRKKYLDWVIDAERHLRTLTSDHFFIQELQSARYWHVLGSVAKDEMFAVIYAELEVQRDRLEEARADLATLARRLSNHVGRVVILDTNVLLHGQDIAYIDWMEVIGQEMFVRLVVPFRIITELDAKKYSRRKDLSDRSRRVLSRLEKVFEAGVPAKIRDNTTVEVVDPGLAAITSLDADGDTLETCLVFQNITGRKVRLVTGDTGMTLRARALDIDVCRLPEKYQAGSRSDEPKEDI